MRFVTDRCIVCGTPRPPRTYNGHYVYDDDQAFVSDEHHEFHADYFWFCSEECYKKAYSEYMPDEYIDNKYYSDDESYQNTPRYKELKSICEVEVPYDEHAAASARVQEAFDRFIKDWICERNTWRKERDEAIEKARLDLHQRLLAEHRVQFKERMENLLRSEIKEIERQMAQNAKLIKADQREYNKLAQQLEQVRKERDEFIEMVSEKPIPPHIRFEHTHILGPSGSGKTHPRWVSKT